MKKIITIIGTRPQFIKAAPISKKLDGIFDEVIVNTGQHYDYNMSEIFIAELGLKQPHYTLDIKGTSHGEVTGQIMIDIEKILIAEKPTAAIVFGDTNSTLAGALAASKLNIPIIHVEAGLRSYDKRAPEEINRIIVDRISTLLFCPHDHAKDNLNKEGIKDGVHVVGDVMFDAVQMLGNINSDQKESYAFVTIHRANNTDSKERLSTIFDALLLLTKDIKFICALHPRTKKKLQEYNLYEKYKDSITFIQPQGYKDNLNYIKNARLMITDSGGIQKEAYFLRTPCLTLRDETEWFELCDLGWNYLQPPIDKSAIVDSIKRIYDKQKPEQTADHLYGNGKAAEKIVDILKEKFN